MSQEDADRTFDAAIELETKLSSKIYTTKETHRDDYLDRINNEMTYSELTSLSKVFPLDQILSAFGYQYDGNYLVFAPDYIKLLDEIYTEENLEGMKALMLVCYLYDYRMVLDKEICDKFNELQTRQQIVVMRMENIRNRITPHFIYNALNHEVLAQMEE